MAEFSVSITQLRAKADEFEGLNKTFFNLVDELKATEEVLAGQWDGEAKEAFRTQFKNDMIQLNNFYNAIAQYVNALNEISNIYATKENAAIDIAHTRKA